MPVVIAAGPCRIFIPDSSLHNPIELLPLPPSIEDCTEYLLTLNFHLQDYFRFKIVNSWSDHSPQMRCVHEQYKNGKATHIPNSLQVEIYWYTQSFTASIPIDV